MRSLQTVAALTCMKTLLMIFNVLFWVSGIVLLVTGVWLHVELHKFVDVSGGQDGAGGGTAPYVLIGTGLLILFLATLACCCTVNEQPVLLYIYAAFLSIVFVVEVSAVVSGWAYRNQLSQAFETGLNSSMQVYNVDYSRTSSINSIQAHIHCCGVRSPGDWYGTPLNKIPGSCCKTNMGCDTKDLRVIYREGCYTRVASLIRDNLVFVAYVGIGVACFQSLGIALTILLAKLLQKTKYEQMS